MRRLVTLLVAATLLSSPTLAKSTKAKRPPDILLIVLDDVGFSDIGAYGSEIRTPVIDALAAGGLRYNRFDTRAVCSATRAALLTGRNNQSIGMEALPSEASVPPAGEFLPGRGEMPRNAETLAQALQAAGYANYAFGKWHLAPKYDQPPAGPGNSWPLKRGFKHFYGFISGWTDQYKPQLVADNSPIPVPNNPGYHITNDLVDRAIGAFDSESKNQPTFVYLALGAAHSPIQVPKSYIDAYSGVYESGWDALRDERFARQKALKVIPRNTILPPREASDPAWASLSPMQQHVYARYMAAYAGFISHADEQIGRIVSRLKATGRFDNTIIIVMSDNGPASEAHGHGGFRTPYYDKTSLVDMNAHLNELGGPTTQPHYQRPWAVLGATPYRRYKLWPYSGGIRTPLIISWPDRNLPAGEIRTQPVDVIDIAPTLLEAAGTRFASVINMQEQLPIAGRSISATFASPHAETRKVQFFAYAGNRAIRVGKWEAVRVNPCDAGAATPGWKLYDSSRDFAQARDLAAANPQVVARLEQRWNAETSRWIGAPLPQPTATMCRFWYHFDEDQATSTKAD